MDSIKNKLTKIFKELYPDFPTKSLENFIWELKDYKDEYESKPKKNESNPEWYKDAVVYSLYVDLFNNDFSGLIDKLPYLKDLGVNCLWLLPVLESPMRDAGFDISDYRLIRKNLVGEKGQKVFYDFLNLAHEKEIKVIFDIAINHTSNQHYWFKKSALPEKNIYSDYYIWSDNDRGYSKCRLLFKGMCHSNWEKHENGKYYFHRFFEFQPDLNYRNPNVLFDMCRNFMFWIDKGVDGFRADAIPYLWKEEDTDCENLENTHNIVKFFRAVIDFINPSVMLLAEACQPPKEVVKYMGDGDECHAGYNFPLMPQMFKSIALKSLEPVKNILDLSVTPVIPENSQWFTFLRCHDELSLELVYVSEEDRKFIHETYCHDPKWDFRVGEGISARLSELFKMDPDKILAAFNLMLTLPGTPVIYYGDEFAKTNDWAYYNNQIKITGHDDTRNLVRGKINWDEVLIKIKDENTIEAKVFLNLKEMISIRKQYKSFSRGRLNFDKFQSLDIIERVYDEERIRVLINFSGEEVILEDDDILSGKILYSYNFSQKEKILKHFGFIWIFL
ncbi:MAG: alpha-amylase family glycosyl hydrolase [Bacteroidales bacterium]|jgi:maltose alpha-D-glucosyltransferase/alpha-amylase|nr:alpha-amylase family glycosyl hydrolase [Bacteroidales bacterium]HOL97434.1 alpha-amylase family glycosyl hydrolase [Bacteroidales bacterium]HOM36046.1 alpha-amylase family glycosyl hydrolase [Bacteroidales bacterium]HPD23356.1 alpha-amylase family glycosyl hydrolase [Bacteroidales bacterium]HRS99708.1 alpha-amylase family glycosyl hydrolase [Bacteroidales bacterium]